MALFVTLTFSVCLNDSAVRLLSGLYAQHPENVSVSRKLV